MWEFLNEYGFAAYAGVSIGVLASLMWFVHRRLKAVESVKLDLRSLDSRFRELQRWAGNIDERVEDLEDLDNTEDLADEPRRNDPESTRVTNPDVPTAWDRLNED